MKYPAEAKFFIVFTNRNSIGPDFLPCSPGGAILAGAIPDRRRGGATTRGPPLAATTGTAAQMRLANLLDSGSSAPCSVLVIDCGPFGRQGPGPVSTATVSSPFRAAPLRWWLALLI